MNYTARRRESYESAAHKLLCGNRELYFRQSAATRNGVVAPFPGSQSGATPPGPPNPAGCLPDPDDSRDWDGRPLTYAELSRGW